MRLWDPKKDYPNEEDAEIKLDYDFVITTWED
jgi:hypothetical protein